jgi:hypothetical protein
LANDNFDTLIRIPPSKVFDLKPTSIRNAPTIGSYLAPELHVAGALPIQHI